MFSVFFSEGSDACWSGCAGEASDVPVPGVEIGGLICFLVSLDTDVGSDPGEVDLHCAGQAESESFLDSFLDSGATGEALADVPSGLNGCPGVCAHGDIVSVCVMVPLEGECDGQLLGFVGCALDSQVFPVSLL